METARIRVLAFLNIAGTGILTPIAGELTAGLDAASLARKEAMLDRALRALPSLIVAYSGGVDSAYLAYVANDLQLLSGGRFMLGLGSQIKPQIEQEGRKMLEKK